MRLRKWAEDFGGRPGISRSYRKQLIAAARSYERWKGQSLHVAEVLEADLERHVAEYAEQVAPATAATRRRMLVTLLRSAAEAGHRPEPRRIRTIRVPRPRVVAWTVGEVRQILRTAEQVGGYFADSGIARAEWWSCLIRVAWETGFRLGDLVWHREFTPWALKAAEIVDHGPGKAIWRTQHKTGLERLAPLTDATAGLLEAFIWSPVPREPVFPQPWHPHYFSRAWGALVAASGVRFSPFGYIRKSSASNVYQHHGWDAAKAFLGHVPADNTATKHYIDVSMGGAVPMPEPLDATP